VKHGRTVGTVGRWEYFVWTALGYIYKRSGDRSVPTWPTTERILLAKRSCWRDWSARGGNKSALPRAVGHMSKAHLIYKKNVLAASNTTVKLRASLA
jgi:hypothetical protein